MKSHLRTKVRRHTSKRKHYIDSDSMCLLMRTHIHTHTHLTCKYRCESAVFSPLACALIVEQLMLIFEHELDAPLKTCSQINASLANGSNSGLPWRIQDTHLQARGLLDAFEKTCSLSNGSNSGLLWRIWDAHLQARALLDALQKTCRRREN